MPRNILQPIGPPLPSTVTRDLETFSIPIKLTMLIALIMYLRSCSVAQPCLMFLHDSALAGRSTGCGYRRPYGAPLSNPARAGLLLGQRRGVSHPECA